MTLNHYMSSVNPEFCDILAWHLYQSRAMLWSNIIAIKFSAYRSTTSELGLREIKKKIQGHYI